MPGFFHERDRPVSRTAIVFHNKIGIREVSLRDINAISMRAYRKTQLIHNCSNFIQLLYYIKMFLLI
jgi:hypothetical protein